MTQLSTTYLVKIWEMIPPHPSIRDQSFHKNWDTFTITETFIVDFFFLLFNNEKIICVKILKKWIIHSAAKLGIRWKEAKKEHILARPGFEPEDPRSAKHWTGALDLSATSTYWEKVLHKST